LWRTRSKPVEVKQAIGRSRAKRLRPNSDSEAEVARLVTRASVLLEQGDIGAARIALERAAGSISGGHFLARRPGDRAGKSPLHAIAKPTTDDRRNALFEGGKRETHPICGAEPRLQL